MKRVTALASASAASTRLGSVTVVAAAWFLLPEVGDERPADEPPPAGNGLHSAAFQLLSARVPVCCRLPAAFFARVVTIQAEPAATATLGARTDISIRGQASDLLGTSIPTASAGHLGVHLETSTDPAPVTASAATNLLDIRCPWPQLAAEGSGRRASVHQVGAPLHTECLAPEEAMLTVTIPLTPSMKAME